MSNDSAGRALGRRFPSIDLCSRLVNRALTRPCSFPSCSRLENTIPTFEPHVGRDLYIRSPDVHNQQIKPYPHLKASEKEVRMYHSRIAHDHDRCAAQRLRINILDNNGFRFGMNV